MATFDFWAIEAGLLVLMLSYSAVLVHAMKGSQYSFVYIVGGLGLF